ncbi:MAG: ABC transporter ATP-binding protein [Kiloniellales bacterium]|nr:ABC transporter ATP-binding protein [Kiloniellales bacterium]
MVVAVRFSEVSRHFGATRAVDKVSFEIRDGEFFSMLGPSGSGKTTCLRIIAGFEIPDSGDVLVHNESMAKVPPYDRDVNTVFQDYALFPHMTVLDNVAYSLMVRKIRRQERYRLAEEALSLVRLSGLGARKPAALSGGQRQRVALARALINHPSVLLLDEPLGALDQKLREEMQVELKALQRKVGITFIYVTHDQQEALSMSDRLAVFNEGRIEQIGSPEEIYERPVNPFVARFVGAANLIDENDAASIAQVGEAFSIRPERIHISSGRKPEGQNICALQARIESKQYMGAISRFDVVTDGGVHLVVTRPNHKGKQIDADTAAGAEVWLSFDRSAIHPMPRGRPERK